MRVSETSPVAELRKNNVAFRYHGFSSAVVVSFGPCIAVLNTIVCSTPLKNFRVLLCVDRD